MTDPQNPQNEQNPQNYGGVPQTPPPASYPGYPAQPDAGAPYGSAPAPAYGDAPAAPIPGRTLGIVAFILSFFTTIIALILGIVALVQSKKAGHSNGFALAAIIISSILTVVAIIVSIVLISYFASLATAVYDACSPGGSGFVEMWGQTIPCSEISTN